ncbi:hypothetical protein NE236_17815 [Actinoallomurus purpureus]|uniref:hypothetical protein n=1 Tax=Actinoallomurus purpureus TaxID=478114 RepID=UPI0020935683|nr:hypothetical protein [Actinoallomurus purpureus]MCO6006846.1 hypothetical protein [Actinoallomurus purpureus]
MRDGDPRRVRERLAAEAPGRLEESGFTAAYEAVCSAPGDTQQRVLGHPSAAFWTEGAWDLLRRHAHERFPEVHLIPHLRESGGSPSRSCAWRAGTVSWRPCAAIRTGAWPCRAPASAFAAD